MSDKRITGLNVLSGAIADYYLVGDKSGLEEAEKIGIGTGENEIAIGNHSHSGVYEPANANIQSHIPNTSNPHSVTKSQVGLGSVSNIEWGDVNAQTDSYTLQSSDNGKVVTINKSTAATVTIPDSLSAEFSCTVIQTGAGQVTFAGSGSMTLRNRQFHTKMAGQYGAASLYVYATNNILLQGDTTA
jgi:hypothetical protein